MAASLTSLCSLCASFNVHNYLKQDGHRDVAIETVQRGRILGCPLCASTCNALEQDSALLPGPEKNYCIRFCVQSDDASPLRSGEVCQSARMLQVGLKRRFWKEEPGKDTTRPLCEFRIVAEKDSVAWCDGAISHYHLENDPGASSRVSEMQRLIALCRSTHESCRRSLSTARKLDPLHSPLPTRCIRLTPTGMLLASTTHVTGSYITLSHRWNSASESCKTTPQNVARRTEELRPEELPASFLDAIALARKLEVEYVWIDSICIIQHYEDWTIESLKMAQYYQHPLCNIAIVDGGEDGFLKPRPSKPYDRIIRLPYRDRDDQKRGFLYLYEDLEVSYAFYEDVSQSVLMQRGWVFQEWLLSPRILYVSPRRIFFECQTRHPQSETGATVHTLGSQNAQRPVLKSDFFLNQLAPPSTFRGRTDSIQPTKVDIVDKWYSVVEAYARLHLTQFEQDRVLALAGVATEIRDAFDMQDQRSGRHQSLEYVAGLWLRDICHGLLWESMSPQDGTPIIEADTSPSWSWTSMRIPVKWPERDPATKPALDIQQVLATSPGVPGPARIVEVRELLSNLSPVLDVNTLSCTMIGRGRVLGVEVHGRLQIEAIGKIIPATINIAQQPEDHEWPDLGWRAISCNACPSVLCGWGSFERSDPIGDLISEPGSEAEGRIESLYAVHVSTTYVSGGLTYGYFALSHPVYAVIFCAKTTRGMLRRVGVGRIFAKEAIMQFNRAAEEVFELI